MVDWNGKPYHSLDYELKRLFGKKVYKLSLDGGMTCPNRDGRLGARGCIFCSEGGSGDFAESASGDIWRQIEEAEKRVQKKMPKAAGISDRQTSALDRLTEAFDSQTGAYIAYFQSFTNTYAPVSFLRPLFTQAITHPHIAALSIGTRPDCLPQEVVALLSELNRIKPVWVELGLQTIHEDTARFIRRGYELPVFEDALTRLKHAGLTVIVHTILGLPGESQDAMKETVRYLAGRSIDGIKLQLLHILKGTDLADYYQTNPFPLFTMDSYIDFVIDCVELLPPEITIHRLTGDGPKRLLIAPEWSANKRVVQNELHRRFNQRNTWQGAKWEGGR